MNDPQSELPPWLRGVGALQVGLATALLAIWIAMGVRGDFWRSDFTAFYIGWRIVVEGHGDRLYDSGLQKQYQDDYVPERSAEGGFLGFVYPPPAAVALAPLAWLPRMVAFYCWAFCQLVFLVVVMAIFLRWMRDWPAQQRLLALAALLAFPPLLMTFQLGQFTLASLLCMTGFYAALRNRQDAAMAAWLVLLPFKPQLLVIPAVTLLATRRWKAVGWTSLFGGAWVLLTMALLGRGCWLDFLEFTRQNAQKFGSDGITPNYMYNLKGFLAAMLGTQHAVLINVLTAAALLLAMLFTAWCWHRPWQPDTPAFWQNAALSLQLGLICNPHFNPADALCLVLPALFFLLYLRQAGRPWQAWATFVLTWPWLFAVDAYAFPEGIFHIRPFFPVMLATLVWMLSSAAPGRLANLISHVQTSPVFPSPHNAS